MTKTDTVRARIEPKLKRDADARDRVDLETYAGVEDWSDEMRKL